MPPFAPPLTRLISKERPESVAVLADRIYIGTNTGNLLVYDGQELVDTKSISRRAVDQVGVIKDLASLLVLSDMTVTLWTLPALDKSTVLAKNAFSFGVHASVRHDESGVPTVVTRLVAGCRRKAIIYTWHDGEALPTKEVAMPHSARTIVYMDPDTIAMAYTPTEFAILSLETLVITDIVFPTTATSTFTGITGYMTLGLGGAKSKPVMTSVGEGKVLIAKNHEGLVFGTDAKPISDQGLEWPAPPEDMAFIKPYTFTVLPAGTVPTISTTSIPSFIPTPVLQIRSSFSTHVSQTLTSPEPIRLLTLIEGGQLVYVSGTTVYGLQMNPWTDQLDELVTQGQYAEALALLDLAPVPDKTERRTKIQAVHAVGQFKEGAYMKAIETFIELNINPAKVVALYPEKVSGRLSVKQEEWIPLFGGPAPAPSPPPIEEPPKEEEKEEGPIEQAVPGVPASLSKRFRGLGGFIPGTSASVKDDDTASIRSVASKPPERPPPHTDLKQSMEALFHFLGDRRPKVNGLLAAASIVPSSQPLAPLSELFEIPSVALAKLTPDQLIRVAQVVDTALFKAYLVFRPGLVGSLCRVPNWCEVEEVEEELRERGKYSDLVDLYHGKKMHSKALELLKQLADDEDDIEEALRPTVSYLQKLGPEHLDLVFDASRWAFARDSTKEYALRIFQSEDVELPRGKVVEFLQAIDERTCAMYLEYLIEERGEASETLNDRLVEVYLSLTVKGDQGAYEKMLKFIESSQRIRVDRLYGMLSSHELYEARALLLGRLGRHDQALELYVYKLSDYVKAEEYCKHVYEPQGPTANIFLTLLRIYLNRQLLQPALDLVCRHSPRLDSSATLSLIPPLVSIKDIHPFLVSALREPVFDTRVMRNIAEARKEEVERGLMILQRRRVKVTDARVCPSCKKRIGSSVIAVHAPRGEVTHYQCREAFAARLKEMHV